MPPSPSWRFSRRRWRCTPCGGSPPIRRSPGARPTGQARACCRRRAPSPRRWCTSTHRWKGIFAHHTWIVVKDKGADAYTRYDKVAWGQPVKTNNWAPDARWYGHRPILVGAVEGPAAEALIPKVRAAVARYPFGRSGDYSVWPGPNSNSFTAYVLGAIPEAGIALPPTAVGKDWRIDRSRLGLTASGTGVQLSLHGLFGITVGWVEGIEVNVLGLVAGLDVRRPALKLPGIGRIGLGAVA